MKTLTVGELKSGFSAALDDVLAGETIVISYGRDRREIAALVPLSALAQQPRRTLGVLKGQAKFTTDFALHDETLLSS